MRTQDSICVVGTGPVGMATALRLADQGVEVTVVDGGGPDIPSPGAEFNRGKVVSAAKSADSSDSTLVEDGTLYVQPDYLARTRRRGTSGSGWQWGVLARTGAAECIRLVAGSAQDFEPRPELDIPGWVTPAEEIQAYYPAALTYFGLHGHTFNLAEYSDGLEPLDLAGDRLNAKLFHFGQADMIRHVRIDELRAHPNVTILSGQNLIKIQTSADNSRVTGLVVSDLDGNESTVTSDHYVLGLGGIENSRQLLLAAEDGSLNDPHDVFGRWFMDHPHFRFGFLTPTNTAEDFAWYDFQDVSGTPILRGHELSSEQAAETGDLRFAIDLVGRHQLDATAAGHSLALAFDGWRARSLRQLLKAAPQMIRSPGKILKLVQALRGGRVYNTAFGGWSEASTRYPIGTLSIEAMFEQRPSRDNRVRLGDDLDRFGRRLPNLQWSWSQTELDSVKQAEAMVDEAFRHCPVGDYTPLSELGQGPIPRAGSGAHHIGGTRQSESPRDGVVDGNNRVHGVQNLTMIGSSVFPTSVGYANPTLTAIADGIRVADHLAKTGANVRSPRNTAAQAETAAG